MDPRVIGQGLNKRILIVQTHMHTCPRHHTCPQLLSRALFSSRASGWWPLFVCCLVSFCLSLASFPIISLVSLQIHHFDLMPSCGSPTRYIFVFRCWAPWDVSKTLCLLFPLSTQDDSMHQTWLLANVPRRHCSEEPTFC